MAVDWSRRWSVAELERAIEPPGQSDMSTEDTLATLYADGLVHRTDDFVFATRAAHAATALPS